MSRTISTALIGGSLALALTACGTEPQEDEPVESVSEDVVEYDPMTREYSLSEDAATRRAAFDSDGFQSEYAGYRDEIIGEQDTEESMASEREGENMADGGTDPMMMPQRDGSTNMRARKDMTWGYLDRNDDDRLSVGEYAIWAIPLDPNAPARNDETAPYLTAEQANKAADSFFYYDLDGDTYLDRREFTAARRGENFDPQETA